MTIKIKREQLERIVVEELTRYLAEQLNEAPPSRGTVLDDEPEDDLPPPEEDIPTAGAAPEEQLPSTSPAPEAGDDPGEPPELPGGEDEAEDDLDALEAGEEPPSEEEEGTVAGELSGKTIENITVDEDSKVVPGATEVIFTFHESPDALRIMVTKTGKIKYFYRGLHNSLDSMVSPMPAEDAPEDPEDIGFGDEEEPIDEPLDDVEPLGDEDMPLEPTEDEEELP